jgi:hypothetical protein
MNKLTDNQTTWLKGLLEEELQRSCDELDEENFYMACEVAQKFNVSLMLYDDFEERLAEKKQEDKIIFEHDLNDYNQ